MIYQIFVGRFSSASIVNHSGNVLNRMMDYKWSNLKKRGFTHVYLLGLFDNRGAIYVQEEEGETIVSKLRLPSVFALSDHRAINPALGTRNELIELISKIQSAELKVIVDFVPNHRGLEHIWRDTHPDYFHYDQAEKLVKEFSGDVIKLDYQNFFLRKEMIQTLTFIAGLKADGVRCDMAHFVILDFWQEAVEQVKALYPNFTFMGEVYPENEMNLGVYKDFASIGFTGLYHGVLFSALEKYFNNHIGLESVCQHLNYISNQTYSDRLVNYVSNHDDILSDIQTYREALVGLLLVCPGNVLIFNGTLLDRSKRLAHHYYDELKNNEIAGSNLSEALERLLEFKKDIFIRDQTFESLNNNILCCRFKTKTDGSQHILLANLGQDDYQITPEIGSSYGIINNLSTNKCLEPGMCEIFILE